MYIQIIFLAIIFLIFFNLTPSWWDAVFPIVWNSFKLVENSYLFIWSDWILWSVNMLNNIRWLLPFITSNLNLFNFNFYLFIIWYLGWLLTYLSLKKLFSINDNKWCIFMAILSLFFIVNPITVWQYWHYLILQWFFLYIFIIVMYYYYLIDPKKNYLYWLFFCLALPFLWQPHNYYNIILLCIFLWIFTLYYKKIKFKEYLIKNFNILFLVLLIFSGSIFLFFSTIPNDLTSSISWFDWWEPNMVWSWYQWIINTFTFKKSSFWGYNYLLTIFFSINVYLFFVIIFNLNKRENKFWYIVFCILISLSFIWNNPLLQNNSLKFYIYKFIPHLRVDVSYLLLIIIPLFILWIAYIYKNKKISQTLICILLIVQISISTFLLFERNNQEKNSININEYSNFQNFINSKLATNNGFSTVLFWPLWVTYNLPWIEQSIYPTLVTSQFENKDLLHWNFLEIALSDTWKFISNNINSEKNKLNIENTTINYIVCFNKIINCNWLIKLNKFDIIWIYKDIFIFERNIKTPLILSKNANFSKINPTSYKINLNLGWKNNDLYFLESFHPNWKIYLEPFKKNNCNEKYSYYLAKYNVTECWMKSNLFSWWDILKLIQKPVFDESHQKVFDYANKWTIDKEFIIKNYSKEYYRINQDWSIDILLSMYFKPQSYFYLWILLTWITMLLIMWFLIFSKIKKFK